jgi:hypothetical protein
MTKNDSLIAVAYHANSTEMAIFIIQHADCKSLSHQKFIKNSNNFNIVVFINIYSKRLNEAKC